MNPEIKSRWVEALRSGKYKQGKSYLRRDGNHCCLGVLCDIVKDEIDCEWKGDDFKSETDLSGQRLIDEVVLYCGVSCMGNYSKNGELKYLTDDNDNGKTFDEIADIIEQYL